MLESALAAALGLGSSMFPYAPAAISSLPHLPYRVLTATYLSLTYGILPFAQMLLSIGHLLVLLRLTGSFGTFKSGFRHRLRDWPIVKYFNCIWYICWMVAKGNVVLECVLLFMAYLAVYWIFAAGCNAVRAGLWWGMSVTRIKQKGDKFVRMSQLDEA